MGILPQEGTGYTTLENNHQGARQNWLIDTLVRLTILLHLLGLFHHSITSSFVLLNFFEQHIVLFDHVTFFSRWLGSASKSSIVFHAFWPCSLLIANELGPRSTFPSSGFSTTFSASRSKRSVGAFNCPWRRKMSIKFVLRFSFCVISGQDSWQQ